MSTSKDIEEILKWLIFKVCRECMGKHFPLLKHSHEIGNFLTGSFLFFFLLLLFPTENDITETDLCATHYI